MSNHWNSEATFFCFFFMPKLSFNIGYFLKFASVAHLSCAIDFFQRKSFWNHSCLLKSNLIEVWNSNGCIIIVLYRIRELNEKHRFTGNLRIEPTSPIHTSFDSTLPTFDCFIIYEPWCIVFGTNKTSITHGIFKSNML